jgi:outer membrane protein TolC
VVSLNKTIFLFLFTCVLSATSFSQERTLDYFLQKGLSNSPLLKDLQNQARSNSIDSLLIKAQREPQINFNGTISYSPVINGYGYSEAITNGGNFITTINLSQSLFNTKTVNARYEKAGIQRQSLANSARLSENDLKKEITAQYLSAYSVSAEITSGKAILKSLEDENDILYQLTLNGIYKQTDYLSFKVELQARRLLLNELLIQYLKEISTLNYICGIEDTTTYELPIPVITVNIPPGREASPYFLRFRFDSLAIQNEKLLLDRSYKPVVSWFADAGLVNNQPEVIYKNFGASLGLSMTLPVYDGNQRKLNYEKFKNSEETRRFYEQTFRVRYNEQLRQLNQELEMTREMIPGIKDELELAKAIIRQDKDLISSGGVSITDYLLAVRNYIAIQQYLNQYEVKILQIINEINYWEQ